MIHKIRFVLGKGKGWVSVEIGILELSNESEGEAFLLADTEVNHTVYFDPEVIARVIAEKLSEAPWLLKNGLL